MVVTHERRGRVEVVTIDRPEARNAVNAEVTSEMTTILDAAETDREVWAVVITGAGDRAFCAGMDLKAFSSGNSAGIQGQKGFAGITRRDFPKPLIAAVNGHALAGGFEIVLACDLVVAAEHATFGIPEVKRGLVAAAGGLIRLPKRVSLATALELAMTGDAISAERAFQLGIVNKVVPGGIVVREAVELAERICEASPAAVRASKRIVKRALQIPEEDAWRMASEESRGVMRGPDPREGSTAFVEKRAPNWAPPE